MNPKGRKTTTVAFIALGLIIALLVALFLKIIDANGFKDGLSAIVAGAVVVIGFLSKDVGTTGI